MTKRYDQCDGTCTVDCGHCKGKGRPKNWYVVCDDYTMGPYDLAEAERRLEMVEKRSGYDCRNEHKITNEQPGDALQLREDEA